MEGQGGPVDGTDGRFNLWRWFCHNHSYNEPWVGGRALFTFVNTRVLRRFPACTGRHMARLAGRRTVVDVTTFKTTAYRYTSRAQSATMSATREPM